MEPKRLPFESESMRQMRMTAARMRELRDRVRATISHSEALIAQSKELVDGTAPRRAMPLPPPDDPTR